MRRKAALLSEPLDHHLVGLVNRRSGSKNDRIALAAELVSAGVLSQRAAHEVTGVARETIRTRTAKKPPSKINGGGRDG